MRTALVTGGAQRIGAGISRALSAAGYAVAIHCHRSRDAAEALAAEFAAAGERAAVVAGDLTDPEVPERLIAETADALSPPLCVVNCAATFDHDTPHTFDVATWDRQFAANLRGPALIARAFAAALPAKRKGVLIHLLDQKVETPSPDFFSYTLTKSALATMTRLQAIAFAPRIRVNAVAPGLTLPSGAQNQARFAAVHDKTILGRGSTVADIADAVLYLAEAPAVTGQVLYVDGGERLTPGRGDDGIAPQ